MSSGLRAIGMHVVRPLLSLLGLSLAVSCSPGKDAGHRASDVLVRINEDDAKGFDPQAYSDLASTRIASEQFEGLTRFNALGQAEPGLARTWRRSADGLVWIFELWPNLKFSDGTLITAETFESVFRRLHDPKTASPHLGLFGAIDKMSAINAHSVEIRLANPFPALPELLAHPALGALPLHRQKWQSERPLVTSGAYRVREWALGDHISLEANPAWHSGKPATERVEWKPISDSLSGLRLFLAGGADTLGEIPSTRLSQLKVERRHSLRLAPYGGTYYFAFNTRRPPFDDPRVRLALSMAVERSWLTQSLLATGVQPAWGVVPPSTTGLPDYRPAWADWSRPRRLETAAELLRASGYGPQNPLSFEMRFNSDVDHRRVAVALAAMWRPLGVSASLLNSEASLHFASLRRGDFTLARSGWIGDIAVPENYLAVHQSKSGPVNYSGFDDRSFDKALEAAIHISDAVRRAKAMRKAESYLMASSPILPLYFYVSKSMVADRVIGWQDNLANVHPSRTLSIR